MEPLPVNEDDEDVGVLQLIKMAKHMLDDDDWNEEDDI